MEQYNYRVNWSSEDNVYVAVVLEFKSLVCHGDTAEVALEKLRTLVEDTIKDLEEKGESIPEPIGQTCYTNLSFTPFRF
jgi:predicted RNase H-like HicB family nuclease